MGKRGEGGNISFTDVCIRCEFCIFLNVLFSRLKYFYKSVDNSYILNTDSWDNQVYVSADGF